MFRKTCPSHDSTDSSTNAAYKTAAADRVRRNALARLCCMYCFQACQKASKLVGTDFLEPILCDRTCSTLVGEGSSGGTSLDLGGCLSTLVRLASSALVKSSTMHMV